MAEILRFAGLETTRWRNGAGRKADIAAADGWMVGFAWLDADAPFSDYTGHDRTITLVDGPGFSLVFTGAELVVDQPRVPTAFDGGAAAQCRVRGPCLVLNAMTPRDRFLHSVEVGAPGEVVCVADEIGFAVVLEGMTPCGAGALDALRLTGTTELGAATVACIRIRRVA